MFDLPVAQIGVLVHPESIVHSLVEFVDGSVLAQLAPPDMRLPIHVAFQWPERVAADLPRLDLARLARLHFTEPDETRFPCLRLARQAAEAGGTCPAVLNAANELAVDAFLSGHIAFSGIWRVVEQTLQAHRPARADSLESVIEADAWARQEASRAMGETSRRRGAA
jgi:1-deoxy-D-xylulose-5-phosphate reductoisomerase